MKVANMNMLNKTTNKNMHHIKILFVLTSVFFLTSCANLKQAVRDNRTPIEKAVDYARFASYFACAQVIDAGKSSGDKKAKALIIYDVSLALAALSATDPTAADIEMAIVKHTPDKMHWDLLAQEISRIYLNLYENVQTDEEYALLVKFVNEISEGCVAASQPYISEEIDTE